MAVTYDKIAYPKIEEAIKFILDDNFPNVFISPVFNKVVYKKGIET